MDRPSRSLRTLPVRISKERSKSRGRASKSDDTPKSPKTPKEKDSSSRKRSPPRRSRSRSAGRRKVIPKGTDDEKKSTVVLNKNTKPASPPKKQPSPSRTTAKIRGYIKEKVDNVRKSLSPEIDEIFKKSLSRFEEVKTEVVRSLTPKMMDMSVTAGNSVLLRRRTVQNNVASIDEIQEEEYREESVVRNHVSELQEASSESTQLHTKGDAKSHLLSVFILLILGLLLSLLVLFPRIICSKDDCRLILPKLERFLNLNQYFDKYVWLIYSGALLLFFVASNISERHLKKTYISYVGVISMLALCGAGYACHQYYDGLRHTKPLLLLTATIFHMLFFIVFAAKSTTLLTVSLEPFVTRLSALLTMILLANLASIEKSREVGNIGVYLALIPPGLLAFHSLAMEQLPTKAGPLSLLYTSLKPFIFTLPHLYISANNLSLNTWVLGAAVLLGVLGYLFLAFSQFSKLNYLINPYSQKNIKQSTVSGMFVGGMWKNVRHADLLGILVCELSIALSTYASPLSWALPPLSVLSALLSAAYRDKHVSPSYLRTVKYSVLPFIY